MNIRWQKTVEFVTFRFQGLRSQFETFYSLASGQKGLTKKFLLLFFSWFSLLLFFSFCFLAEQNPFRLFLPFSLYSFPARDSRELVTVYLSNGEGETLPVTRKILKAEGLHDTVYQLIGEVGAPPYGEGNRLVSKSGGLFHPKKLLDIRFALRTVWYRSDGNTLILHWDSERLRSLVQNYRLAKTKSATAEGEEETDTPEDTITYYTGGTELIPTEPEAVLEKRRQDALRATLNALDDTLFHNLESTSQIRHVFTDPSLVPEDILKEKTSTSRPSR